MPAASGSPLNYSLVILGVSVDLAFQELTLLCAQHMLPPPVRLHQGAALIETDQPEILLSLLDKSGGIVKIAPIISQGPTQPNFPDPSLVPFHPAYALSSNSQEVNLSAFGLSLKKYAQASHQSVPRFRLLPHLRVGSGITSRYQEFILFDHQSTRYLAHTTHVQDLARWRHLDYDRPAFDARSGMLPPKIAQILINFAFPQGIPPQATLYDPFCGSGTILMMALNSGLSVIGSDIQAKAAAKALLNCQWLADTANIKGSYQTFVKDATNLTLTDLPHPVEAVVFEGFLGPPHLQDHQVKNYYRGLKKLYQGVLKRLAPLIKPDGRLVCALPQYQLHRSVKTYDDLIDLCEKYGYSIDLLPQTYGRETAIIKRRIYTFKKK